MRTLYCAVLAALLFGSGIIHLCLPSLTDQWMSRPGLVRSIGAALLLLAVPCLVWRGWYFWLLFAGLAISGLWRLGFPENSIRAQRRSYPRWVHGLLLLGGATLVWTLKP